MLHQQQAQERGTPHLNYVWVGPPATKSSGDQPGSDIAYVMEMLKCCQNPANYFCLDKHAQHYQRLFAENNIPIKVKSIESFLKEMTNHHDRAISHDAKKMLEIMRIQLSPPRDEIRDRVFFKDAFNFFLLAVQGGYTLDTNLRVVDPATPFVLPNLEIFAVPYNFISEKPSLDVFIMYAPSNNREQAKKMIGYYLSHWDNVQKEQHCSQDDIIRISRFHKAMAELSIDSLATGLQMINGNADSMRLDPDWRFTALRPDEFALPAGAVHAVRIAGLPLIKIFSNSHKPEHEIKKMITEKIIRYKNDNPQFARYKTVFIALLDSQLAKYKELDATKSMDMITLNRKLYGMIAAFVALDKIAVEASPATTGFLALFRKKDPARDVDPRVAELYAKAARVAAESMEELGEVNPQTFKELFAEFQGSRHSPVVQNDATKLGK